MMPTVNIDVSVGDMRAIPFANVSSAEILLVGPAELEGISLRDANAAVNAGTPTGASAAFTAAAAGSASLGATDSLSGFDVSMAAVAAAVGGTVTVTNVVGGPYVYQFEGLVGAASLLSVRFATPLLASGGAPTVTISAIAGGGAGDINVFGVTNPGLPVTLSLDDSGQSLTVLTLPAGGSTWQWFGDPGIHVSGELKLTPLAGSVTGLVYARFGR